MPRRNSYILLLAALIILVGVVSFIVTRNGNAHSKMRSVVVMNNGQTYFGYLSDTDKPFFTLKDVYYPHDPASVKNINPDVKKKVSLFRYGDEVYGPEALMRINRDDVVYYSVMRDNSKINEAINRFVDEQAAVTPTPEAAVSQEPQ